MSLPDTLQDLAQQRWQQLCERHRGYASERVASAQPQLAELAALSQFAFDNLLVEPEWGIQLAAELVRGQGYERDYAAQLAPELSLIETEEQLQRLLRRFRRRAMLSIAAHDLLNQVDVRVGLSALSELADTLITEALGWLYQHLARQYGTPTNAEGEAQPMLVLGMGKLGGGELNFSSDIDLIFCYPEPGQTEGARRSLDNQQFFTKLGQRLIQALDKPTVDGFVYRVDMRLRPFGDSGPLVLSFAALENYYQDQGRDWERYAMVKARVLGASCSYQQELEAMLRPFVYRRYIDFSAIKSLREMKAMIRREVRRKGQQGNIKLGEGGIREVEFLAQVYQLIRGGREPALRTRNLLETLAQLAQQQLLSAATVEALTRHYCYLRKVEHTLQQFADQQTQLLPNDALDQTRLAHVMGHKDYAAFLQQLQQCHRQVAHEFDLVIGEEGAQERAVDHSYVDIWNGAMEREYVLQHWQQQGFAAAVAEALAEQVVSLRDTLLQRPVGNRGRQALERLLPIVLERLAQAQDPVSLLERLQWILEKILTRTAYLELLVENPGTVEQLCRLCAASPWIAQHLARMPLLLDELLDPAELYNPPPLSGYRDQLRQFMLRIPEDDLEQQMEALRQFQKAQQLRIAASDVTGVLPLMKISDHLTALAEAMLDQVIHIAWQHTVARFGRPQQLADQQMGFGVIGYGKVGGLELGYGSDLDLVFVHESLSGQTDGEKSLEVQQFYVKLAQRIRHLFTTRTPSGVLYELDMRLRPSGESGLLACSLERWADYQQNEAWTWERQALVRTRMIFGEPGLRAAFASARERILCQPRALPELAEAVAQMRYKMFNHLNRGDAEQFDLKQSGGGIVDIEFIAQYLVLGYAHQYPELVVFSDNIRIFEAAQRAGLLSAAEAEGLKNGYCTLRDRTHSMSLEGRSRIVGDEYPAIRALVRATWCRLLPDYLAATFVADDERVRGPAQ